MFCLKKIIACIYFLSCFGVRADGFLKGTLVKTSEGFVAIERLKINDTVICRDNSNKTNTSSVLLICKKSIDFCTKIYCDNVCVIVSHDQLFYNAVNHHWVCAAQLGVGDFIDTTNGLMCEIKKIEYQYEQSELYRVYIKDHHNFCVTTLGIVVHNFIPFIAAAVWAFGAGGIELVSLGFGVAGGTLIGYSWYKKHKQTHKHNTISIRSSGGGMFPEDPDDDDKELTLEEKRRKRDGARVNHKPLNNAEAREKAQELGYKEVKDHPAAVPPNSLVFRRGDRFISADKTGHKGVFGKCSIELGDELLPGILI